jgi:hypothetical protein
MVLQVIIILDNLVFLQVVLEEELEDRGAPILVEKVLTVS